jgi:hypothetical protein
MSSYLRSTIAALLRAPAVWCFFLCAAQIAGLTPNAYARDQGQYDDAPPYIRDWFKALKIPQNGNGCCDLTDCARTQARTQGDHWKARAPDGSWIDVPADTVVRAQGNPTGEPVLCAYEDEILKQMESRQALRRKLMAPPAQFGFFCFAIPITQTGS